MADECPWSGMDDGEDAPAGFAEWAASSRAPAPAAAGREASPQLGAAPLPGADLWSNWRPGGAAVTSNWERGGFGSGGSPAGGWTQAKSASSWSSWGSWDRGRGRQTGSWGSGSGGRWDEGETAQHTEAWRNYSAGQREEGARPSHEAGGSRGHEPDSDPLECLQGEWVDAVHASRCYSVRGNFCIVRRPEPPTYARFSLVVRDGKVWWGSLCKFVLEWQGDVAAWLALPGNRVSFRWLRGKGYHASPRPADQWRKAVMASSWRSWDEAPAYWAAPRAPGQTYSAFSLEEEVAEEDTDEIDKTVDPFELPDKVWHSPPDDEANVNTSLSTSWIIWDEPATASASSPGTHASEAELETAARAIWGQLQSASVSLARPALHGQEPRALQPQGAPHDFGLVVKSFDPTEYGQDYMRLNEGDIVRFIREDDGWYLGERVDKETLSIKLAEGWFPPAFTHFD